MFVSFGLRPAADSEFHIAGDLAGEPLYLHLLGLLCGVCGIFFKRHLGRIDGGLNAAQTYPHLLVEAVGVVGEIDRKDLRTLLVCEA